jgi:DNA polymerase-3 subunit epsilon
VIAACADELAAHEAVLDGLDKAIKGSSVWRVDPATASDEQTA